MMEAPQQEVDAVQSEHRDQERRTGSRAEGIVAYQVNDVVHHRQRVEERQQRIEQIERCLHGVPATFADLREPRKARHVAC
jgi:hypothetical protein